MRIMRAGVVAAVMLLAGCSTQPSAFTSKGTLSIMNGGDGIAYETAQSDCTGTGGYNDIGPGAGVTIYDAAGKVIATGQLKKGAMTTDESACVFPFTVTDVPAGAKFYQVEISHRGKVAEKEADLRKGVQLSLGG